MSGEDEGQLPGKSAPRRLLEAMRDAAVDVQTPPVATRITIKGEQAVIEAMLPGVREAFYPKDGVVIGEARFNTVSWDLNRPANFGQPDGPWTLTVELIEART